MGLDRQRTDSADIQLLTLPTVPGSHIVEVLGTVYGLGKALRTPRAMEDAMNEIRAAAHALAADAVIGIQCNCTDESGGGTRGGGAVSTVVLLGTAVLLAWPDGHGEP